MIPKRHQANKWRLIVDLSSPKGGSVNDGVDRSLCSFDYIAVTDIGDVVLGLGRGALLAKSDIRHAYRQVPVHPAVGDAVAGACVLRRSTALRLALGADYILGRRGRLGVGAQSEGSIARISLHG